MLIDVPRFGVAESFFTVRVYFSYVFISFLYSCCVHRIITIMIWYYLWICLYFQFSYLFDKTYFTIYCSSVATIQWDKRIRNGIQIFTHSSKRVHKCRGQTCEIFHSSQTCYSFRLNFSVSSWWCWHKPTNFSLLGTNLLFIRRLG